ncbi:putative kinase-like protein TMKL1 [Phoenix dactylifera]|uniref:Kinase-like protein TMKL1 n=1 Tax=Phoenix dactylifera TaxID=42345 RepID=A0A8B9AGN4_PHODC|nr:putative kinase-like protein TMKL1 [Phoenix dactylifera]
MEKHRKIQIVLGVISPFLVLLLLYAMCCCFRRRFGWSRERESLEGGGFGCGEEEGEKEAEELTRFAGGEHLTVHDILDAPGEVVGKSSYATLYRASLQRSGSVVLLRFVRPACVGRTQDVLLAVRKLGHVRHPNLVPMRALYAGPRGETLFVHPFYSVGTLSQFLRDGAAESHRWEVIYKLSLGIVKGLHHLHTALQRPIVHGNLKSNNILLDADLQPHLSDFGLHLLLNPAAVQEMLEASAARGYKAPELIKMKDASTQSDIYSLGVVLLELLARKEIMNNKFLHSQDLHLPTSLRNLVCEHKVPDAMNSAELINQSMKQNFTNEDSLQMFFQLAMACCSPTPALRPDIKCIVRRLEEIGQ